MKFRSCTVAALGAALLCGLFTGCQNMNNTQKGAGLGAGLGAALGAIIGHQSDKAKEGAAVGAALGGIGGALAGNAQDMQEERDAAVSYAAHQERRQRAQAKAMTNQDVVMMAVNNVSDSQIVETIRDSRGHFDTSPTAVVYLQQQGVNEDVIRAMRENALQ